MLSVIVDAGFSKSASGEVASSKSSPYISHSEEFPQWIKPHAGNVVRQSFELDIPSNSNAISQIDIAIPDGLKVSDKITVSSLSGGNVNSKVAINNHTIIIDFPQTVSPGTKLEIDMNKVRMLLVDNSWIYKVSVKPVHENTEIPIGVVRFRAYL